MNAVLCCVVIIYILIYVCMYVCINTYTHEETIVLWYKIYSFSLEGKSEKRLLYFALSASIVVVCFLNGGGDVSTVVEIIIVIYTKNEMENGKLKKNGCKDTTKK